MALRQPKVDKTMPIVNVAVKLPGMVAPVICEGVATPQYQRFIQTAAIKIDSPGGTTSFAQETAADPYDPAQQQRIINALAAIYSA